MIDKRIEKQAKILVDHSIRLKKKDRVVITADFESRPLVEAVYKLLVKGGAGEIRINFSSYQFSEIFYNNASNFQIDSFPKILNYEARNADCNIIISSPENTRGLTKVDAKKIVQRSKVLKPITSYRVENTRWVITRFPSEAKAQESEMSLTDYSNFVFKAINGVDWKKLNKKQEKLRKLVDKTDLVRIVGAKTDLKFSIKGRKAVNCSGENNMPDGEVFTSVIENSAEGYITFSYPCLYYGREFDEVKLEFKKGKAFKATARKGEQDLNKILDSDRGARYIGEFGIGNNYKIKRFTKDILFDEKIGGTIHLALGKGYKETISKNKSFLHWDMIKDLRKKGELYFDGSLVQKNGKWLV